MRPTIALAVVAAAGAVAGCGGGILPNEADNQTFVIQASGTTRNLAAVGPGLGIGTNALYAESDGATLDRLVLRYDQGTWSSSTDHAAGGCLTCRTPLSTTSGGISFGAGTRGIVQRYDTAAAAWVDEPTGLKGDVLALWASDDGATIVAVGDGGGIAIRRNRAWTVAPSPTTQSLRAVWGAGAFIYAAGDLGAIVRFDGMKWTIERSGTVSTLRDIWLSVAQGVFAVGDGGVILHRVAL